VSRLQSCASACIVPHDISGESTDTLGQSPAVVVEANLANGIVCEARSPPASAKAKIKLHEYTLSSPCGEPSVLACASGAAEIMRTQHTPSMYTLTSRAIRLASSRQAQ
jgi:hypothetical protein